ncbi:MAG: HlyC/CorC family transporter [Caulobacter sp.]|nr:HlyC/CorC family transporter [Caulobacter sp.]
MTVPAILIGLAPTLVALITASGLISASETAMTAASRGRMHQLEREGDKAAARVNRMMADQENMIGAILLSNNAINILATALTTAVLSSMGEYGVAAATAIMTVVIVIFAEILPKTLAITRPEAVARTLSLPILWLVRIFGPLARGAQWIVRMTLRPFGINLSMETDVLAAHEEIRGAVEYHHSEGVVESRDRRMLGGVLDLSEMDVSDVMVHRKSVDMLDAAMPPRELIRHAMDLGHSRLPLWRDNPDNVVGVLNVRDLVKVMAQNDVDLDELDVAGLARKPWFVPETTKLKDQLNAFLKKRNHFALVVDEYGGLQGVISLEDILEEIVGEIDDEHDSAVEGLRPQPDGWIEAAGIVTVRDLNRALDWDLPDDQAVTIAGLLIQEAQAIPEEGETFTFYGHRFEVVRRRRNQITALRISPPLAASPDWPESG